MSTGMVRYKVKRDQLQSHLDLLRAVYEELESTRPDGLRCGAFQLEDELSFVEFVVGGGQGRLAGLQSFPRYRANIAERCDEPPVLTELHEVGTFRLQ